MVRITSVSPIRCARARELRPASWTNTDARRSVSAAPSHPRAAPWHLHCSKASNEVNFLAQKLVRVGFGTHNVDSCNRT